MIATSPTGRPYLRASDGWTVHPIDHAAASALVTEAHYARGASRTAVACHGLFDPSWRLVGAAMWMPPLPGAARTAVSCTTIAPGGVLALSRLVVRGGAPANATGFLLGRSMAWVDRGRWPCLLTFADLRLGHEGVVYKATNWEDLGLTASSSYWTARRGGAPAVGAVRTEEHHRGRDGRARVPAEDDREA